MTIRVNAGPWASRDLAASLGGAIVQQTARDAGGDDARAWAVERDDGLWGVGGTFRRYDPASGKTLTDRINVSLDVD